MKNKLASKITLTTLLILGIGITGIAYMSYFSAQKLLQEQYLVRLNDEIRIVQLGIKEDFESPIKDLNFLANNKDIQKIFDKHTSIDKDAPSIEVLRARLEELFSGIVKQRPAYMQLRLIGLRDKGREIIRVERNKNRVTIVPRKQLQQKSHRGYFKDTIALQSGEFSAPEKVSLNQEYGQISEPHTPVIQISTPIYSHIDSDQLLGILVVNLNFNYVSRKIETIAKTNNLQYFIASLDGEYLYHTDDNKASKFDLGKGTNFYDDFKDVEISNTTWRNIQTAPEHYISEYKNSGLALGRISLPFGNNDYDFILGTIASFDTMNESALFLKRTLTLTTFTTLIVIGVVLMLITNHLLGSIRQLLIAEDLKMNFNVVNDMLQTYGMDVTHAKNGQEAVDFSKNKEFDLIFMDCQMPVMNGFEATKNIRSHGIKTPILALTANVQPEEQEKCFTAGMDDFVPKPLTQESLKPYLQKWLLSHDIAPALMSETNTDEAKNTNTVLDYALVQQFEDRQKDMIKCLVEETPTYIQAIKQAIKDRNADDLTAESHALKSMMCQIGAIEMTEYAKILEAKGHDNNWDHIEIIFEQTEKNYDKLKNILIEYAKTLS